MEIVSLDLPPRVAKILDKHGIETVEGVIARNTRELLMLDGFGQRSLMLLELALTEAGYQLSEDPYGAYVCAREGERRGDAGLASLFLCERCATDWQTEPFGGTEPAFVGEGIAGYCVNCNELREDVHLFQWFLCGNCERVARSIGRSVVAARAVMAAWEEHIRPSVSNLKLLDVDTPRLLRRTPEAIRSKVTSVDFIAVDVNDGEPVLGIEMKGGKGHIGRHGIGSQIAEFQLDTSDCDDILTVVAGSQIPVCLVHAQVIDRAQPPTIRYAALGLWWTDLFSMEHYFDRVQKRPRETRMAAYFDTAMFREFPDLAQYIVGGGLDEDRARLRERDWSLELYRS